ncbi:hypothetical protein EVAR_23567_1 [Eumeta japonica]|uniref:Uncharacterized protein n=1 Tax=Eumeta variegata TaxID=151549 RepID=A0A4C1WW57_EUMVA|nr:hypothetical protein EVAR_23567_1 [Eumeta japonica]
MSLLSARAHARVLSVYPQCRRSSIRRLSYTFLPKRLNKDIIFYYGVKYRFAENLHAVYYTWMVSLERWLYSHAPLKACSRDLRVRDGAHAARTAEVDENEIRTSTTGRQFSKSTIRRRQVKAGSSASWLSPN